MRKFGKKVEISTNPLDYNICILGESKIGKTTIAKQMCEKLVGDDGYIHLDIGREEGSSAIEGLVSESIEDWAKLTDFIDDVVENKEADYKDLKTVIFDTLDELIILAENESIRQYNRAHSEKKTDSINGAWGGFGKGQDYAANLILDAIWELKKVGVNSIIIGHVKRSDITDPVTQETFSKLTADTTQRYFNVIKNKMHFVALAYIDREIVKEKTGRQNVVTKKDIEINKAVKESRVISFRDDTYSVDSGSRFADIIDRIAFDPDEFINAMQDAINKEKHKGGKTDAQIKKEQKARDEAKEEAAKKYSEDKKNAGANAEKFEELYNSIKNAALNMSTETQAEIRSFLKEHGLSSFKDKDAFTLEMLEEAAKIIGVA